ncbi:MAG: hypothetical protein AAB403_10940 [Planctomycetota bacterium]
MAIPWKRRLGIALGSLLAAVVLSGCEAHPCPEPSPLELATNYPHKPISARVPPGPSEYSLPLNAWVDHRGMTEFLRNTVMADGVDSLVSKYRFHCVPRAAEIGCVDCYTCTRNIAKRGTDYLGFRTVCVSDGEILVQVAVGPGPAVRAMTYWNSGK